MATDKDFKVKNGLQVDTDTLVVDATNDRVGINKASPTATLDIDGTTLLGTSSYSATIDTITDGSLVVPQGSRLVSESTSGQYLRTIFTHESSNGHYIFGQTGTSLIGDMKFYAGSSGNFFFASGGSDTTGLQVGTSTTISYQPIRISSGGLQIGTTEVISSARALDNITTINASSSATASGGFITTSDLALRDYTTDARIHLGNQTGGASGVFAGRRLTTSGGLLYGTYWAYDAFWDDTNQNWTANRSTLGRKWKAEMGYHIDAFKVSRFDGTVSSSWDEADWTNLLTIQSATSTFNTNLTVYGNATIASTFPTITFTDTDSNPDYQIRSANGYFQIYDSTNSAPRFNIQNGGDVSFYNSAGTTQDLFWDASASRLGIATTSPTAELEVRGSTRVGRSTSEYIEQITSDGTNTIKAVQDSDSDATHDFVIDRDFTASTGASNFHIRNNGSNQLSIDKNANVTIAGNLTVNGTTTTIDTTNTNVKDNNITLNYSTGDSSATANGSGITIQDAVDASTNATILWDSSSNRFDFSHTLHVSDGFKFISGNGSDFQFFHNGTDSLIDNLTGDLYITNKADDKDIIFRSDDGSGGFTEYFRLDGSLTRMTANKNLLFFDNIKADFGNGSDLRIFHDGTDSTISNGTGHLNIITTSDDKDIIFKSDDGSGGTTDYLKIDGSTTLIEAYKDMVFGDSVRARFGNSSDLQIWHNISDSRIQNNIGDLILDSTSIRIKVVGGSSNIMTGSISGVSLYHNGNTKFQTTSTGIDVTGNIEASGVLYLSDQTATDLSVDNGYFEITTGTGYTRIGSGSSSYTHFYTDRQGYYFNQSLTVDSGIVSSYDEDIILRRSNSSANQLTIGSTQATFTKPVQAQGFKNSYIGFATTPANTAGWFKIGRVDRGTGRIILSFTGGNYSPTTYEILYFKNWSTLADLQLNQQGSATHITSVRIREDSSDSLYYIEIYCASDTNGKSFQVFHHQLDGYFDTDNTAYTGSLTAGSASGTTHREADFVPRGRYISALETDDITASALDVDGDATISGFLNFDGADQSGLLRIGNLSVIGTVSNFLYIDPSNSFSSGIYINNEVRVDGGLIGSYNEDLQLRTSTTTALTLSNTDQSATFAGTISSGAITSTGQFSVNTGATGTLAQFRGADTDLLNIDGDSNAITLDARNVSAFNIEMQGTNALTIDNSQNATFAGTISSGAITATGRSLIKGLASSGSDYALQVQQSNGQTLQYWREDGVVSTLGPSYFFVQNTQGMYVNNHARFRGGISNDLGDLNVSNVLDITGGGLKISGTEVITSARSLTNIASANIGGGTSYFSEKLLVQGLARFAHGTDGLEIAYGTGYGNHGTLRHDDQNFIITMDRTSGTGNINLTPYENVNITTGALEIGGTSVISANRNLLNIGTISTSGNITAGSDINISGDQLTFTNDAASAYIRGADALFIQSDYNTGENKPIYLQPSATTEVTVATGQTTFAGSITSGAITTSADLKLTTPSVGTRNIIFDENGSDVIGIKYSGNVSGNPLDIHNFQGAGTTLVRITETGNFQIGTTTVIDSSRNLTNIGTISSGAISIGTDTGAAFNSAAYLKIQPTGGNAYINIKTGTTGSSGLLLGDTNDSYVGGLIYNNSTDALTFNSGNATALTLDASQNATFASAVTIEGTTTFNDDVSFNGNISSNMNLANNAISAGDITSTGDVVSTSTSFIEHKVDQTDSGSIAMGVTSGTANGFLLASNTGTNHVATAPTLQFFLATDGGSTVEEVRIDAGGLDIRNGGLDINGTEVITSARDLTNIGTISSTNITSNGAAVVVQSKPLTVLAQPVNISSPNDSRIKFFQTTSSTTATKGSIQWFDSNSNACGSIRVKANGSEDNSGVMEFYVTSEADEITDPFGINKVMTIEDDGVTIHGSLSKSSGSFRIDHPLKPLTHDLVHSFVESPQADNIYRGVIKLEKGRATVDLDEWFGMTAGTFLALNREIQAFVNNADTWDNVRAKVMGSQLVIECQNPESTATVSWLVIGERQDKEIHKSSLTDDHGKVIVEPLKVG